MVVPYLIRLTETKGEKVEEKLIFVVDDNETIRMAYHAILSRKTSYRVHCYACPGDLLDALEEGQKPDLILTDNDMPGMTGTQLVKHLREIGFSNPIIMSSGSDKPQRNPILRAQIDGFIPKPSPIQDILNAVIRALASK